MHAGLVSFLFALNNKFENCDSNRMDARAGNKNEGAEMGIVSLQGRITINNANEMRRILSDALRPRLPELTVELSGVTYMDTSGLATLMETMRIARQQGTRLVLSGIQNQPRYLLQVTDLDHVFEIEEAATT
jgi:anti-sigma B factor antagonist